jgi:hypothetical protein
MENDIWKIVLENYQGEDATCYFENYEIAKKNFNCLRDSNKDMPEFEIDDNTISWYDCHYNEYNTFIYLSQGGPKIYNKIIF